jgi:GAF domain-containing protein
MRPSFQLLKTDTQRYAFLGALFGLAFPIIATLIRMQDSNLPLSLQSALAVQEQDTLLWIIDTAPLFLGFFAAIAGRRQDTLKRINQDLQSRERELYEAQGTLEQRVADRTQELLRAAQLELIAQIAQSTVSFQDLGSLLPHITKLISQSRNYYHIGIFLLDANKEYAILSASNSSGGAKMLARGHRLKVGAQGMVGYVSARGTARIALNVGEEAVYFNNPDLPETQSEIALPMKFGGAVTGVLDIQSVDKNAFSQQDIEIFSILADQVSGAIQNVRSREQAQRALQDLEIATSQLTGKTWKQFTATLQNKGFRFDGVKSEALRDAATENPDMLTVPVELRGQLIGRLKLKPIDANRTWTDDEQAIITSTAQRLAVAMESARLLDDAQKRAIREERIAEISSKLSSTFQLDSILRDTVEELGQTLTGSVISFQLVNPSAPPALDPEKTGNGSSHSQKAE